VPPSALQILIAITVFAVLAIAVTRWRRRTSGLGDSAPLPAEWHRDRNDNLERGNSDDPRELESAVEKLRQEIAARRETRFRVLFHLSAKAHVSGPSPVPAKTPSDELPVGGARVLVVDDDEAVRELACEFLARANFDVVTADGGAEALRIFTACSDEIDVVLLDLSMPDIDGRETYGEIRRRCPDTPVILVSGYSEEMAAQHFIAEGEGIEFLAKPYSAEDLVERIRHCTTT